jgi:O-antigen/teichoic acid export membrane protein
MKQSKIFLGLSLFVLVLAILELAMNSFRGEQPSKTDDLLLLLITAAMSLSFCSIYMSIEKEEEIITEVIRE